MADDNNGSTWMFWKNRRYVVTLLSFLGFFMLYVLRVNLSVAIVKMTENSTRIHENGTVSYEREFDWDTKLQGYILSSFFYGYISTPLAGGWLASRIGGKRVFGFGIAATAFFTTITPPITRYSVCLLIFIRVIEGIFEGVTYPAINAVMANWAPPLERSKLVSFAYSGSFIGTVLSMPLCSIMAERLGWPSLFYAFGAVGLLWYICWILIVRDRPEDDPYISESELKYIKDSLESADNDKRISHPWRSILTSPVVWAIIAAHTTENWGFYTMITQLPTFMNDALNMKLEKAGFLAGLPYLAMAIVLLLSGHLADYLRTRNILTTTQVRKTFTCTAFVSQTIFMALTAFILTPTMAVTCITIAIGLGGLAWAGFSVNYLEVGPQHASVIFGIGNTIATLPGIISPIVTGYMVPNKTADEWRIVFLIASGFYLVGAILYGIFSSAELQPWAVKEKKHTENQYDNPIFEVAKIEEKIDNTTYL